MNPVNRGKIGTQWMNATDTENNFLRKCTVKLLKPTGYVIKQQV